MRKKLDWGGVALAMIFLASGVFLVHYGIDNEQAKEKSEVGYAIGTAVLSFIMGMIVLNYEMRKI